VTNPHSIDLRTAVGSGAIGDVCSQSSPPTCRGTCDIAATDASGFCDVGRCRDRRGSISSRWRALLPRYVGDATPWAPPRSASKSVHRPDDKPRPPPVTSANGPPRLRPEVGPDAHTSRSRAQVSHIRESRQVASDITSTGSHHSPAAVPSRAVAPSSPASPPVSGCEPFTTRCRCRALGRERETVMDRTRPCSFPTSTSAPVARTPLQVVRVEIALVIVTIQPWLTIDHILPGTNGLGEQVRR